MTRMLPLVCILFSIGFSEILTPASTNTDFYYSDYYEGYTITRLNLSSEGDLVKLDVSVAEGCEEGASALKESFKAVGCHNKTQTIHFDPCNDKYFCLLPDFNDCDRVHVTHDSGISSNEITLSPNRSKFDNEGKTKDSGWQIMDGVSTIHITREGAPKGYLTLKGKADCATQTKSITHNESVESVVTFRVTWNDLDKNCTYRAKVFHQNACGDNLETVYIEDLIYEHIEKVPDKNVKRPLWVVFVMIATAIVFISLFLFGLWRIGQRRHLRLPKDAEIQRRGSLIPLLRKQSRREVLVVYAEDVTEKAHRLLEILRSEMDCSVIDLHDVRSSEKVQDATAWLDRKILQKHTKVVLVASKEVKDLQCRLRTEAEGGGKGEEAKGKEGKAKETGEKGKVGETTNKGGVTFDFLLEDFLQKMENRHFEVYQVQMDGTQPSLVDNVADTRVFRIPEHKGELVKVLQV